MKRKFLYDIIELWILSYQSREFNKFFWAINCCSYKTHGFHKIFASENISAFLRNFGISHFHKNKFREIIFTKFRLIYFREKMQFYKKIFSKCNQKCSNLWTFTWFVHFEPPFRLKRTDKIHTEGFSKFHSNIYSILFDYSLGNKTFQIIHQLSYFVGQPVHDILFYS